MKFFLNISMYYILFASFLSAQDQLSVLAQKYGTDKSPITHNYTPIYHFYFKNIRYNTIKFLEIGFFRGGSARMWEKYFQNAELYFIDVRYHKFERYGQDLSERCHFYKVNQENANQLKAFIIKTGGNFDIIIDDGGHSMRQQITSFEVLFPAVKSGGLYIIEDLHTSYWKKFGGYGTISEPKSGIGTTMQFLKDRLDDVNHIAASTKKASRENCSNSLWNRLTYYQKNINSIHFYSGVVFIFKR